MSERSFILKVVRETEERFACICFAHKTNIGWIICMDDYDSYMNKENRPWFNKWHEESKKRGLKIVFCYCNSLESKLLELAKDDNLILNI